MGFTREELAAYEKKPQTPVSDKVNPFRGATPAAAASAAAVAAVAAGNIDATPGGSVQAASTETPVDENAPLVDEEGGTIGDPSETGEGTSDVEATSDSSTDPVDHGDEADPNSDLTGEEPAPKKGSARERIVEVLDLAEGYKEYGKLRDTENRELRQRLARLENPQPAAPAAAPPAPVVDEPMPDMSDEDVAFDNDKYRTKMAKWVKNQTTAAARAAVQGINADQSVASVRKAVEAKIATFMETTPDFKEKVTENEELGRHQLAPDAGAIVAESENTAELLYRFGSDLPYAIRLARMSPRQQVQELTRLDDQITAEKKAKGKTAPTQPGAKPAQKKSITQAPPPPTATRAAAKPEARSVLDPNMGMEEFARQHRAGKQRARADNRKSRGLN